MRSSGRRLRVRALGVVIAVISMTGLAVLAAPVASADEPEAEPYPGITYNMGRITDSIYFSRSLTRQIADQMDADSSASALKDSFVAGLACAKASKNPYVTVVCGAIGAAPRALTESAFKNAKLKNACVQLKWYVGGVSDSGLEAPPIPKAKVNNGKFCKD